MLKAIGVLLQIFDRLLAAARERRWINIGRRLSAADQLEETVQDAQKRIRIEKSVANMSPDERDFWLSGGGREGDR